MLSEGGRGRGGCMLYGYIVYKFPFVSDLFMFIACSFTLRFYWHDSYVLIFSLISCSFFSLRSYSHSISVLFSLLVPCSLCVCRSYKHNSDAPFFSDSLRFLSTLILLIGVQSSSFFLPSFPILLTQLWSSIVSSCSSLPLSFPILHF